MARANQRKRKGKLKELGLPAFAGWFFTRNIPQTREMEKPGFGFSEAVTDSRQTRMMPSHQGVIAERA
jgi:hypothetical protein